MFIRLVRTNVISTFNSGYVEAARSRGVSKRLLNKHAWRPALIPIITVMGMQIAMMLAGAVLTETTFEWKGLGFMLSQYLKARDFVAVQGIVILIAIIVAVVNFIVDVIAALIDPSEVLTWLRQMQTNRHLRRRTPTNLRLRRDVGLWHKIADRQGAACGGRLAEGHARHWSGAVRVLPDRCAVRAGHRPITGMRRSRTPAARSPRRRHLRPSTSGAPRPAASTCSAVWSGVPAPPSSPSSSRYCCRFSQACCSAWSPAYYGGWVDRVLVMIADAVYSLPVAAAGDPDGDHDLHGQSGLWSGIFASGISITVVYIPQYFRTIRAEVIRIKESRMSSPRAWSAPPPGAS